MNSLKHSQYKNSELFPSMEERKIQWKFTIQKTFLNKFLFESAMWNLWCVSFFLFIEMCFSVFVGSKKVLLFLKCFSIPSKLIIFYDLLLNFFRIIAADNRNASKNPFLTTRLRWIFALFSAILWQLLFFFNVAYYINRESYLRMFSKKIFFSTGQHKALSRIIDSFLNVWNWPTELRKWFGV